MQRGEVWWVDFDERRPVLLLSDEEPSGFQAIQVVAPASTDITGVASEVSRQPRSTAYRRRRARRASASRPRPVHVADDAVPFRSARTSGRPYPGEARGDHGSPPPCGTRLGASEK